MKKQACPAPALKKKHFVCCVCGKKCYGYGNDPASYDSSYEGRPPLDKEGNPASVCDECNAKKWENIGKHKRIRPIKDWGRDILLASNNPNKLREYQEMLQPLRYRVRTMEDLGIRSDPEENGKSYAENAYIKALALSKQTRCAVIADDSGIEIAALGEHFPGIHSARYAASISKDYAIVDQTVLDKMVLAKDRRAAYHCVICYLASPEAEPRFFEGVCPGYILKKIHGTNGFGFDPIFHSTEGRCDFGACSEKKKNAVSHRAKALKKLLDYLATSAK